MGKRAVMRMWSYSRVSVYEGNRGIDRECVQGPRVVVDDRTILNGAGKEKYDKIYGYNVHGTCTVCYTQ